MRQVSRKAMHGCLRLFQVLEATCGFCGENRLSVEVSGSGDGWYEAQYSLLENLKASGWRDSRSAFGIVCTDCREEVRTRFRVKL